MLCERHGRFRIIFKIARKSFLLHYKCNLILSNMTNNGKLNFIMYSWMQFNTIVISGVCGLKIFPSDSVSFILACELRSNDLRFPPSAMPAPWSGDGASAPRFGAGSAGLAAAWGAQRGWLGNKDPQLQNYGGIMEIISQRQCKLRGMNVTPWNWGAKPSPWQRESGRAHGERDKNPPRRLILGTFVLFPCLSPSYPLPVSPCPKDGARPSPSPPQFDPVLGWSCSQVSPFVHPIFTPDKPY